jgi:hypothetical protein
MAFKSYKIKVGQHGTGNVGLCSSDQQIKFKFTNSCLYDPTNIIPGWNKLWGFGDLNNQQSSCRIGWRCTNNNKIILCAYCHVNGQIVTQTFNLEQCLPNVIYYASLRWFNGNYYVAVGDGVTEEVLLIAQPKKPSWLTFQQYPYFGGQSVAPHDMEFLIEKL